MKKIFKISGLVVLSIFLIVGLAFLVYVSDYEKATSQAMQAMVSTEDVLVEDLDDYIVYTPRDTMTSGLIFYPGGKVEPTVYSRIFNELASHGIQTIVVKMPFNLAMFNINGADDVLDDYSQIETWYMGGHSLGGVFATEYLKDNSEKFKGMIYMASYPNSDISSTSIKVLSLNATLDSVINIEGYESAKDLLPEATIYVEILGGNHTQFGDYNLQDGDTIADISPEIQQEIIVDEILNWMSIE